MRRPPGANCSSRGEGIAAGAAEQTTASKGAALAQPARPSPTRMVTGERVAVLFEQAIGAFG